MINSRNIHDLHPAVRAMAQNMIDACLSVGITLLVTSTYRDHASQQALYNQGRTTPGAKVTNARPGQSWHNWRCAFDVVPLVHGKAIWADQELWDKIGEIGEACGLEWAGRWKSFKEMPHFQYTAGLTLADFQAGKTLPA